MLKNFFFLVCITCFLLPAYRVFGQGLDLYVSTEGNDTWEGTSDRPLKSLIGARNKIRKLRETQVYTDTIKVNILPGLYHMSNTFVLNGEDGGSPAAPVIYQGLDNDKTIFSGGIQTLNISGWDPTRSAESHH